MARPLILRPHPVASVTAAPASDAGAPITNVLTTQPRETALWSAGGSITVTLDLGAAVTGDALALVNSDAQDWSLKAAASETALATAPVIASGSIAAASERVAAIWWNPLAATTARWWQVSLTLPAGGRLGRLVLAQAFAPLWPYQWGMTRSLTSAQIQATPSGSLFTAPHRPRWRWQVTFGDVTDAEWLTQWKALAPYMAGGAPVVFCADYDAADPAEESIYALGVLGQGLARQRPNRWRTAVVFEELL
ncbi:MAG: hypothetical protein D6740_09570 [Alphaproteobacteria bacterium]|nr:MAG: hypothetical protein D6740_09570 [Alphaproteobacteria bacterium]